MSAPVDVLAVLESYAPLLAAAGAASGIADAAQHMQKIHADLSACVAELIESAKVVAVHQDSAISSEWDRLDDALARIGANT